MPHLLLITRQCLFMIVTLILSACSSDEQQNMSDNNTAGTAEISNVVVSGPLLLNSIEEVLFQGQPAIAVSFSQPLDALRHYNKWLRVNDEDGNTVTASWILSQDAQTLYFSNIRPRQQYSIDVKAGLLAKSQQTLQQDHHTTLIINNLSAVVGFSGQGIIIPSGNNAGLPVRSINVDSIQVDYFKIPIDKIAGILSRYKPASSQYIDDIDYITQSARHIISSDYQLPNELNQRLETKLPLDQKIINSPGVYLAVLNRQGVYAYQKPVTLFTVTDIGIHIRQYKSSWSVFASELASGEANTQVNIRLLDRHATIISEGFTDKQGRFDVVNNDKARLLIASKGEHLAVLNLHAPALDISDFDLPTTLFQTRDYFIYGPRDLYRPGEQIDFSILLRNFDGEMLPAVPIIVELVRSDGLIVNSQLLSPQQYNYYHYLYDLSASARTGQWQLRVRLQGDKQAVVSKSFLIEDFLPERIRLSFSQQAESMLTASQLEQLTVAAEYLYGAPASGNELNSKLAIKLARSPFSGLKGFVFGNIDQTKRESQYHFDDQILDQQGQAKLTLSTAMKGAIDKVAGPVQLTYRSSVFESGGRAIERALTVYSWHDGIWPGIKANFDIDDNDLVNKEASFQFIATDASGLLIDDRSLSLSLINLNRRSYWEYSAGDGWRYQQIDDPFESWQQQIVTKTAAVQIQIPVEKGVYQLRVTDEQGNTTDLEFSIGQNWWGEGGNNSARPDKISMILEHPAYQAGDKVKINLHSPRPGKGFLLVENSDGVLFSQRISLDNTSKDFEFTIPAQADESAHKWQRHDVRIIAMIVQPEQQAKHGVAMRSIGIQPLPLDRSDRKIDLQIKVAEQVEPQQQLVIKLSTQQVKSESIMLTVAAVDQGVLSVTNFQAADPHQFFYQLRRPQIDARDNYGQVLHLKDLAFASQRSGGDASVLSRGGEQAKSDVLIVSLFKGPVHFDQQGRAEVEFTMPDFNGGLQLMVTAFADKQFGLAQAEVLVKAPIVSQISMPRFAAFADQTQLSLDLHNTLTEKHDLQVDWQLTGATVLNPEDLNSTISLAANQKQLLTVPIKITQVSGFADIQVHVHGGDIDFSRQWSLALRPAYPAQARQQLAYLGQGEHSQIDPEWFNDKLTDSLQLKISLSSQPSLNTAEHWRALLHYPYGCFEQTVSTARPLLDADPMVQQRWQVSLPDDLDRQDAVQDAINRLQSMQRSEGGFGLWDAHSAEEKWLTSYGVEFLLTARDKGFNIPTSLLKPALNRLHYYVKNTRISSKPDSYYTDMEHYRFAYRAYAAYVLASQAQAPLGTLRQWFDEYHGQSESPLPLMHLAVALKLQGDRGRAFKTVTILEQMIREDEQYLADYGSVIRDEALVLALNIEYEMQLKHADLRLIKLSEKIYRQSYLSTQEREAILQLALQLDGNNDQAWSATLSQAARSHLVQGPDNWSQVIKGADVKTSVIAVNSEQKVFVSQTLIANSQQAPAAESNGYKINRQWFDTRGNVLDDNEIEVGDFVIVRLELSAKENRPDTMIVDLLPAGFELENPALVHARSLADFTIDGKTLQSINDRYMSRIKYHYYGDDRFVVAVDMQAQSSLQLVYLMRAVTPGVYQIPSAFVEDMYRPASRAIGKRFSPISIINH